MYNKKRRRSLCEVLDSMYLSNFYLCIHDLRALHSSVFENSHLLKKFRVFFLFNASVANMKSDFLVHKVRADICQACKFSSFSVRIQKKKCWPPKCTCKFYQCNLFSYIFGNLPKNYLYSQLEDPNDISSHHDVWAVQSPKGNIKYSSITISHPFIVLYRLRRWSRGPSSLTSFYGVVFIVYQKDRVFTDGRLFHVLRRLMYMIKPWIL